jgi:hypothetical protein
VSKPASVKLKIAKVRGKAIPPGSTFAKVDWEKAEEYLSGQHNPDDVEMAQASSVAEEEIVKLEAEGRDAKARRVKADLNAFNNARFAIRASWCPTCLNFLHNCQCQAEVEKVDVSLIDKLTSQLGPTHSQLRKAKRSAKEGKS